MKILYIEDSPDHIQTMQRITDYLGHALTAATTGLQGYALALHKPDLIFVDISLPDINGLDLVYRLRAEQLAMPIIAITADALRYTEEDARQSGCDAFIIKPYTVELIKDLFARIQPAES